MRTLRAAVVSAAPLWVPGVALAQIPAGDMMDGYSGMLGGYGGFLGPALLILVVVVGVAVWAFKQKSR